MNRGAVSARADVRIGDRRSLKEAASEAGRDLGQNRRTTVRPGDCNVRNSRQMRSAWRGRLNDVSASVTTAMSGVNARNGGSARPVSVLTRKSLLPLGHPSRGEGIALSGA